MSDNTPPLEFGQIEPIEIQEEMERSFLDYAMSVIVSRALPDVRDGLKPVHRRILWDMEVQGFRPDRPHVKCARVTGDTMANYHPHGNAAIYDALVRMAQPFSLRHPLIDFHGNYGSPDFGPAAERYCVTGDALVRRADGTTVPIADLVPGARPHSDTALDEKVLDLDGNPVRASVFFHSGTHPVRRVRTAEGYELTGTLNHPILCLAPPLVPGAPPMLLWKLLGELQARDVVALARHGFAEVPIAGERDWHLGVLAGALVAEGWVGHDHLGFNNVDREFYDLVIEAYDHIVGGCRYVNQRRLRSGRTIHELDVQGIAAFQEGPLVDLVGLRSADKRVPREIWAAGPAVKQAFLQALFEGDGCVSAAARSTVRIFYSTRSERLAREVQQMLLEFGVVSRVQLQARRGEWKVSINRRDVRRFQHEVGFLTAKRAALASALDRVPASSRALSSDHVPHLAAHLRARARRGAKKWMGKHNVGRLERWDRDGSAIRRLTDGDVWTPDVERMVSGRFYFATVVAVDDAGTAPVYSLRVDSDDHSFITNGFISHNTECRLDPLAMLLLAGIDEDTVDFEPTYDGSKDQPTVLPARFPNLLVNGSQGIAVGMATNIPPHNLGEVIDATVHLIDHPDATPDDLMAFVKGPDFPTGGLIMGRAGIIDAYRTGRGSVKMRAKAEIEEVGKRGDQFQIVVTELPYQVSGSSVAARVTELVNAGELDGVADINDESSDKTGTRIVIPLKRDANASVVLNNLFKLTQLQTTFPVNMVALTGGAPGVPRTLNLAQVLRHYVDHQVEVITRRSRHRLEKAQDRAHILEGLIRAQNVIDEVIALIRRSDDRTAARQGLMAEPFSFSERQASFILDMQLGQLTRLARINLQEELDAKRADIAELEAILADEGRLRQVIKDELAEVKERHATPRRAVITHDVGEITDLELIDDKELVVVMTRAGYVKTVDADAFRATRRGAKGVSGGRLREADLISHVIHSTAHAYLLFFSNRGRVYRLRVHEIPERERTARGLPIVNLLPLAPDERIQAIIDTRDYETSRYLFFATRKGQVKKTPFTEYDSSRRDGLIAINLRDGDELVKVVPTSGTDDIFMVSRKGMTIRFDEDDVRPMGRAAGGVIGMKLRSDDEVVSVDVARDDASILMVTESGYGKRTKLNHFNRQGRGGQGVMGMKLTARKGYLVAAFMVGLDDEIIIVSSTGQTVRTAVRDISSQGRAATGVRVMNLEADQVVASVAPIIAADNGDD